MCELKSFERETFVINLKTKNSDWAEQNFQRLL